MDRQSLIGAMRDLDAALGSPVDIVVVGGAAMILHFGALRATQDIDLIAFRGDPAAFRSAVRAVAADRGLPDDWISDAAKGFAIILPPDYESRMVSMDLGLKRMRVWVLGGPDQAALNIVALREQDLEDLEVLLPLLTEADRATIWSIADTLSRSRPDWSQRLGYFMEERGWTR